jgi:hypothetical protein
LNLPLLSSYNSWNDGLNYWIENPNAQTVGINKIPTTRYHIRASGGMTDEANSQQLLRLIQSVPSPKAEPFKLWLAQIGQERLEEIEN